MTHSDLNLSTIQNLNTHNLGQWQQIQITLNEALVANLLKSLRYSVFLDSGADTRRGNFDVISGEPISIFQIDKGSHKENANNLTSLLASQPVLAKQQSIPKTYQKLPFVCGLIAYCSYEFGAKHIISQTQELKQSGLPSAFIARYTWSYIYDRTKKQGFITFSPECSSEVRTKIKHLISHAPSLMPEDIPTKHLPLALNWQKKQSFEAYSKNFKSVKHYIKEGDCYQVNLAQRFESNFSGKACDLYFLKRSQLNMPYSVFFSFSKDLHILSFSPEQFIGIQNKQVKTRPIKGTAQNTNTTTAHHLVSSTKNKAENLMIVDLMRNDLSKVCELNTIKVTELFKLETYKNVHHLVSQIEGKLKPDINELDAFFSCFPGGSITGAPKKRAMEIINQLEQSGRDAYCGSVFYWNDDGQFDSNILIRTIVHSEKTLFCWGGGGVVNDSTLKEEYLESLFKVSNLTGLET